MVFEKFESARLWDFGQFVVCRCLGAMRFTEEEEATSSRVYLGQDSDLNRS